MDKLKNLRKKLLLQSAAVFVVFSSGHAAAGISGDGYWIVERGDSVYSIARKVFPDDREKQRQFRKELIEGNTPVFRGDPSHINVGDRLQLPAFAVAQPVNAKQPPPPQAVIKTAVVPARPAIVEEKPETVTPDPQEVIGRVVVSVGEMQASNRGSFRKLLRNSKVFKGDTLKTAANAYTQVRMKDGALLSLRPNTELVISEYNFNGREDGTERSFMELLRGGFRTITGYIGHKNKSNYRVKTAVATIGIRGTHYGLMVCADGSCSNEAEPLEDGIYGGVVDGSISVENSSGAYTFNNDQYFHVAAAGSPAVELLVPPPVFHGKSEKTMAAKASAEEHQKGQEKGSREDGMNAQAEAKGKNRGKQLIAGLDNKKSGARMGSVVKSYIENRPPPLVLPDQINDVIKDKPKVNKAPDGATILMSLNDSFPGSTAGVQVNPVSQGEIVLGKKLLPDGSAINNIPIAVRAVETDPATGLVNAYQVYLPSAMAGVNNIGGNPIGVNWGRWDASYEFSINGVPQTTQGPLHYVYSDNITSPAQLANLGGLKTRVYTVVGGTLPTTISGQTVTLNSISMTADFVAAEITAYDISLTLGTNTAVDMMLDLPVNVSGVPFDSMDDLRLKDISVCTTCSGKASAAFVGPNAEGAITTYNLSNTDPNFKEGIQGAAVLVRP